METLSLIDNLEDAIDRGVNIPMTGKCMLDKDELLDLIQEIRLEMPDDLKQAKWIKDERQRILLEAQKEANDIIKSAEDKIISLINENEITRRANEQAEEIIAAANRRAREIRNGTRQFTDDMLLEVERVMEKSMAILRENRSAMQQKDIKRQQVQITEQKSE